MDSNLNNTDKNSESPEVENTPVSSKEDSCCSGDGDSNKELIIGIVVLVIVALGGVLYMYSQGKGAEVNVEVEKKQGIVVQPQQDTTVSNASERWAGTVENIDGDNLSITFKSFFDEWEDMTVEFDIADVKVSTNEQAGGAGLIDNIATGDTVVVVFTEDVARTNIGVSKPVEIVHITNINFDKEVVN